MHPPLPYSTVLLLSLFPANVSLSCSPDLQFQCEDGTCIPITDICSGGLGGCPSPSDLSDSIPSLCSNCSSPHLAHCKHLGEDACVHTIFQCSPGVECTMSNEFDSSLCQPPCSFDMFECQDGTRCIHSEGVCNGVPQCEDWSDQLASQCDLCQDPQLFRCERDARDVCITATMVCDGVTQCSDGTDESLHYRLRPIESVQFRFDNLCSHFIRVQMGA